MDASDLKRRHNSQITNTPLPLFTPLQRRIQSVRELLFASLLLAMIPQSEIYLTIGKESSINFATASMLRRHDQ